MASINVKQEPGLQPEEVPSSAVATAAAAHPSSSLVNSHRQRINQTSLINFSDDEASKLCYPVGCPVGYNFTSSSSPNEVSFTRGCVVGAAMDRLSRNFVYRIQSDETMNLALEDDVAFAMGCPVRMSSKGQEVDGEIVCFSRVRGSSTIDTKYSVLICNGMNSRIVHGVSSHQVKFRLSPRPVTEVEKTVCKALPRVSIGSESETKQTSETSSQTRQLKWKPPSPKKRKALANRDLNQALEKVTKKTPELSLCLTVPQWVLKAGGNLVGTLIAQKKDIETKVNCPIQIQHRSDEVIVSIASTSEDREARGHSVVRFKRIIQDFIIAHLNDDQSKGRLLFDLAKNASGSYRISHTPSGAVKQQSIVDQDGLVWMRLIDIPNDVSRKLQQLDCDVTKIQSRDSSTPIYIGASPLCNPYVLVYGYDLDKVDNATEDVSLLVESYARS